MRFKEFYYDESFASKFVVPALLGMAGVGATYGGRTLHTSPDAKQVSTSNVKELDIRRSNLIKYLNKKFAVNLKPSQITFKKPWDVIKTYYGADANKVYNSVFKNQKIDAANKDILLQASKLNDLIPIIADDVSKYGANDNGGSGSTGVCNWDDNGKPFCVFNSEHAKFTIPHELSHATQEMSSGKPLIFSDVEFTRFNPRYQKYFRYMLDPREFGVRLAQFKRQYYQLTKNIINDEDSAAQAIEHLMRNKNSYSQDVQPFEMLINGAGNIPNGKERIARKMSELLPKVASNNTVNKNMA